MILRLLFVVAAFQAAAQTPAAIWYDTFCAQDEAEKKRVFRAATPEIKAVLARTQIERWRDSQ